MKKLSTAEQVRVVRQYEVHGVPDYQLKRMCKEARISYPKLCKALVGQTGALLDGKVGLTYVGDIINFIYGSPDFD